jgi:uncharacterized protein (DUF58 family)
MAALACGRLFGVAELFALAAAGLAADLAAVAYVRLTRFQLEATRELRPPRVHAGATSKVDLTVRNMADRRSPVLSARDPFDGGRRWARFLIAPLGPNEVAKAAYRLPTERRGVFDLGPLHLQLSDSFGLASIPFEAAGATQLTVYPRVDEIQALPLTRGNDPHAGADHPTALGLQGDDFYALRDYQEGDDLRRVHWGATAKLDSLMIRQEEMPWQGRTTVLLDLRKGVHTAESMEVAISAAASIVTSSWRRRSLVRFVATDGSDSGFAAASGHVEAILERLANATTDRAAQLNPLLARLRREGGGGLAVITTAAASNEDLDAIARVRGRYGIVTLVLLERSSFDPSAAGPRVPPRPLPPVGRVVRVTAGVPFAQAWDKAASTPTSGARFRAFGSAF